MDFSLYFRKNRCGIFDFGTPKQKYRNIRLLFSGFPKFPQSVVKNS